MLSVVSVCLPGPNVSPNSPEVDELRHLRLAHDQLCAALDRLVIVRKAERERVARVIGPLDDLEQLALQEIHDAHWCLRPKLATRPAPVARTARNVAVLNERCNNSRLLGAGRQAG